ncbi:MAG: ArgR family transcriptional regulator [Treponema sp.]|jgi:transcriptional regulator of arginine metabolism|nr:ArgR family transcriptional regulator [Treponema sp.]
MNRASRLKAVCRLIKNNRIESQDRLLKLLEGENFPVTQATLSRDLKLLKVSKSADGQNAYVYTLPSDNERRESEKIYIQDFLRGYISIDWAGNLAVIKTYSGYASVVATALDNLGLEEVMGTISGDNAVFVGLRQGVSGADLVMRLQKSIPDLEA